MKTITSPQNQGYKNALRLKTSRGRKSQQRFIIFGLREVNRAIGLEVPIVQVFVCSQGLPSSQIQELKDQLIQSVSSEADLLDLSDKLMAELAYGDRTDGVVAVAARPDMSLTNLKVADDSLFVILESVEKPGNIGAVLRSIDGAGASGLIIASAQCDPLHPNSIRSSMGSVFSVPIAVADTDEVIAWCNQHQFNLLAAADSATQKYSDVDWKFDQLGRAAIAFGNEANGLSDSWNTSQIRRVSIPMLGICDSLNVSVAASVIVYEAARQRVS